MILRNNYQVKRKLKTTQLPQTQQQATAKLVKEIQILGAALKLPEGYSCSPSPAKIVADGMKAKNFTIYSPMGTFVKWRGVVDLSTLNNYSLAEIIDMGTSHVEVYRCGQKTPEEGTELNRPCVATFRNISTFAKNIKSYTMMVRKMTKLCKNQGVKLLSIDIETGQWKIQIPHFTRYQFDLDDEDEEQEEEEKKEDITLKQTEKKKQPVVEAKPIKSQQSVLTMMMANQNQNTINTSPIQPFEMAEELQIQSASMQEEPLPQQIIEPTSLTKRIVPPVTVTPLLKQTTTRNQSVDVPVADVSFGGNELIYSLLKNNVSYRLRAYSCHSVVSDFEYRAAKVCEIMGQKLSNMIFRDVKILDDLFLTLCKEWRESESALSLAQILLGQFPKVTFKKGNPEPSIQTEQVYRREDSLKAWLERISLSLPLRSSSSVVKFLSRRNLSGLCQWLISNQEFFLAQLTTKLEDEYLMYAAQTDNVLFQLLSKQASSSRVGSTAAGLERTHKELLALFQGDRVYFDSECWLIRLAVSVWYFSTSPFEDELERLITETLKELTTSDQKNYDGQHSFIFPNEFRIFRTFHLHISKKHQDFVEPKVILDPHQQLASWLLSNLLLDFESNVYRQHSYSKFRIRQIRNLLSLTSSSETKRRIIDLDNYLSPSTKEALRYQFFSQSEHPRIQAEHDVYCDRLLNKDSLRNNETRSLAISCFQQKFETDCLMTVQQKEEYLTLLQHNYNEAGSMLLEERQLDSCTPKSSLYRLYLQLYFEQITVSVEVLREILAYLENVNNDIVKIREIIQFLLNKVLEHDSAFAYEFKHPDNTDIYTSLLRLSREYPGLHRRFKIMSLHQPH